MKRQGSPRHEVAPIFQEVERLQQAIMSEQNPEQARHLMRFFKTGPGQYGEGDQFLGLKVPTTRGLLKRFPVISLEACEVLLTSPYHEIRLVALLAMVRAFQRGSAGEKWSIHKSYLKHTRWINNWDLVDLSAPAIAGEYWLEHPNSKKLDQLVHSSWLWDRRIAILSTLANIRRHDFESTLRLAHLLLRDTEDLMHKATGWMLREMGKRDETPLLGFLNRHAHQMPRTMLRYAIEKLAQFLRRAYLEQSQPSKRGPL